MKINARRLAAAVMALILTAALSACGSSYEYTKGDVEWYSTYAKCQETIKDTYYYSNDWFREDPSKDIDELALASMQLVGASVTDDENGPGAAFLRSMGFEEVGFSDFASEDPDDFNYTWGRRTLDDGTVLVAIAVQSAATDMKTKNKGWRQNFMVNGEDTAKGEHFAYAAAADKMSDGIAALGEGDKVKFWVAGQSRGGAIANILAVRLAEKLGDRNAGIYAYTFESPLTVDAETAKTHDCDYIHNYVTSDDFVTMIPGWDMSRYGDTHELKDKKRDEGLADELASLGSGAAEQKPRIIAQDVADSLAANLRDAVQTRADYSKKRTDKFKDAEGTDHEITYSYQDAMVKLMDLLFSGSSDERPIDKLKLRKDEVMTAAEHLAEGLRLDDSGKDPYAEYWTATEDIYKVLEETESAGALTKDELYAILSLAAPVLIEFPEDGGGEPSYELLTDLVGYSEDMTYPHQFDTIIARLKLLAPAR